MSDSEANMDDQELIHRLRDNDTEAWRMLWEQYQQSLYKTAQYHLYCYNLPMQLADDVVQETWCIAIKTAPHLQPGRYSLFLTVAPHDCPQFCP